MSSSPLNYGILEALMLIEEEGLQSRGAKDAEVSQRKTTLGANLEETLPVILGCGFATWCLRLFYTVLSSCSLFFTIPSTFLT